MWKNGLDFGGTSDRKEFWMAFLINFVIGIVVGILAAITGFIWLSSIYSLAILIPWIALGARRLRDGGHSPFCWFLALIPFVGIIILIVFWATK